MCKMCVYIFRFPSTIHLKTETTPGGKGRYIVATKVGSEGEIQELEERKRQQEIVRKCLLAITCSSNLNSE